MNKKQALQILKDSCEKDRKKYGEVENIQLNPSE